MTLKHTPQNDKYLYYLYYTGLSKSQRQNWNGLSINLTGKELQSHMVNIARLTIDRMSKRNASTGKTEIFDENNITFHNYQGNKRAGR